MTRNIGLMFKRLINASTTGFQLLLLYLIMVLAFSLAAREYFSLTNYKLMAANFAIVGIVSAGVFFPMLAGVFDLSIGGIISLISVLTVSFFKGGFSTLSVIIISLLIGGFVGCINGFLCNMVGINPIITTIGTSSVLIGLAKWISTGIGSENIYNRSFRALGSTFIANKIPLLVIYMIVIYVGLSLMLKYTRFGRNIYAVGGNFEISRMAGIDSTKIQFLTYVISGTFAALGAFLLVSKLAVGRPEYGLHFTLDAITICVLGGLLLGGGKGELFGIFMATVLLGSIANGLVMLGVTFYVRFVITGSILIISIIMNELRFRRVA